MAVPETPVSSPESPSRAYQLPPLNLLRGAEVAGSAAQFQEELLTQARGLQQMLEVFGIPVEIGELSRGPILTRFELQQSPGVRLERIAALHSNIAAALNIESERIGILTPIPGKGSVGVEVMNKAHEEVTLLEVLDSREWFNSQARIPLAIGLSAHGDPLIPDLADMPHLLIAGSTGSGKSVCIHAIVTSLLFKFSPDQLRLVMIDSKLVELQQYHALPHLAIPLASNPQSAHAALQWVIEEMEKRSQILVSTGAKDIHDFRSRMVNQKQTQSFNAAGVFDGSDIANWSVIVVVIDGLADLGISSRRELDLAIRQIALQGQAAGIHLVVATPQPEAGSVACLVDGIMPARIAFSMAAGAEARTVFAGLGAAELKWKGDMIYVPTDGGNQVRGRAAYVTDNELHNVLGFIAAQLQPDNLSTTQNPTLENGDSDEDEELIQHCIEIICKERCANPALLQRRLSLGYTRCSRIMDELEKRGIVGPCKGIVPRDILVNPPEPETGTQPGVEFILSLGLDESLPEPDQPTIESEYGSASPPPLPSVGVSAGLRWVPANEPITVGRYRIPCGMIYVCEGREGFGEASAISTRLPVGRPAIGAAARLGYYSRYQWMSPDQRASYLEWLAAGRTDADPANRDLGYVFLFLYGLESRLLIEKGQDQEVIAEIVRLLQVYGPHTRSNSLQYYCGQLIHFWGWRQGVEYYTQLLGWMRTLPVSLLGRDEMAIVLAGCFESNTPLAPELASELTSRLEGARRSVVTSRVKEEFRALFAKRYLECFPGGMKLQRSKKSTRLDYRPCSPSLLERRHDDLSITIPDVLGLSSQFKRLTETWNSCIDDLADYSRARAKTGDSSSRLKAHLALPEDLRLGMSHPLAERWEEILSRAASASGCHLLDVEDAARLVDIPQRSKLTPGQSRELAQIIESLGFGIEPDARHDAAYRWDQQIAVFRPLSGKVVPPSQTFIGASALLKLCVLVAGVDGRVDLEELEVAKRFIEQNLTLSPDDHRRFTAFEQVMIADPTLANNSLSRLAKGVPKAQRELIGEVLVYVAAADNIVTKDEMRALGQIFRAFGLPDTKLEEYLRSLRPLFGEVAIQTAGVRVPGEPIPPPRAAFGIDMALVDRIAQETSEVIGILARVMVESEPQSEVQAGVQKTDGHQMNTVTPLTPTAPPGEAGPAWLATLDAKYHPILLRLLERTLCPRAEFNGLANDFGLMPLDVYDAINEWADEQLGDFLLDGDDPITVHKELTI